MARLCLGNSIKIKIIKEKTMDKKIKQIVETQYLRSDGILDIDKFIRISANSELKPYIKEILYGYPIHKLEILINAINTKSKKDLFRYFIDERQEEYAQFVVLNQKDKIWESEKEKIKKQYARYLKMDVARFERGKKEDFNLYPEDDKVLGYSWALAARNNCSLGSRHVHLYATSQKTLLDAFNISREDIYTEMMLRLKKDELTGSITKEFLLDMVKKGSVDMCVIKLCVKLEAILKSCYGLEGDLIEMLDGYFQKFPREENMRESLSRLRMYRNCLVHAEYTDVIITPNELKDCIDYICKMEK